MKCHRCGVDKSDSEFHELESHFDDPTCIECVSRHAVNPEDREAKKKWSNRRRYMRKCIRKGNYNSVVNNRRRARKLLAEGEFTNTDIENLLNYPYCVYCGNELDDYHVDHITPLSKGGSNNLENLALTCPRCNLRKNDKEVIFTQGMKFRYQKQQGG